MPYSPELEKAYKDAAHKLGLSQKQVKGLHEFFLNANKGAWEHTQEQKNAAILEVTESLKKEFGLALPRELERTNRYLMEIGGQEFVDAVNKQGWGQRPCVHQSHDESGQAHW